ncbi:hypothetical protein [Arthrobacter sp. D2-10]
MTIILDGYSYDPTRFVTKKADGDIVRFRVKAVPNQFNDGSNRIPLMSEILNVIRSRFQLNTHDTTLPLEPPMPVTDRCRGLPG